MDGDEDFMYGEEAADGGAQTQVAETEKELPPGSEPPVEGAHEDGEEDDDEDEEEEDEDELEIVIAPETMTAGGTAALAPPEAAPSAAAVMAPMTVKPVTSQVPVVGQPIPRMDGTVAFPGPGGTLGGAHSKPTVDLETVAQYEGKDLYDADLDSFEDRPWRKPGADITDYFNYGFNELTWKMYCQKQRRIRDEMAMQMRMNADFPDFNMFGEFPPPFGGMMIPGQGGMPGKYQRMPMPMPPMYGGPRPPFMPQENNPDDSRKRDRDGDLKSLNPADGQGPPQMMEFGGGPPRFPPGPMEMYGMPPPHMRHGFDPRSGRGPPGPGQFMPPPPPGRRGDNFDRRYDDRPPHHEQPHPRDGDQPPRHRDEVRVKEKAESGRSSREPSTERSESRGGERRSSHHAEDDGRRSSKRKSKRRSRSRSRDRG